MNTLDYVLLTLIIAATTWYFMPAKAKPPMRRMALKKTKKSFLEFIEKSEDEKHVILHYASQTGTAQDLATRFAKEIQTKLRLKTLVCDIEDYDMTLLFAPSLKQTVHVFFLATYGEGEPTDSSDTFYTQLMGSDTFGRIECDGGSSPISSPLDSNTDSDNPLAHLHFSIFGLGNSTYQYFNAISKRTSARFQRLGGVSLGDGLGDDHVDLEGDYVRWKTVAVERIAEVLDVPVHGIDLTLPHTPIFSYTYNASTPKNREGKIGNGTGSTKNPFYCTVTNQKELFRESYEEVKGLQLERQCYHVEIELLDKMNYITGDHVGIYPSQASADVDKILGLIWDVDADGVYQKIKDEKWEMNVVFESGDASGSTVGFPECTLKTLFTHYVDFKAVVKQDTFLVLSKYSKDQRLLEIYKKREVYTRDIEDLRMNLMDCIEEYGIKIGLDVAVEVLGRIQPRYYSISSSSLVTPSTLSVTAMWVHYISKPPNADPIVRKGLTTTFIRDCKKGDLVPITLRKSHFRLAKLDVPVIMIGPGGFLHERYAQSKQHKIATTLLFYGCRNENEYMYLDEFKELQQCEDIKMYCAYSRSKRCVKQYVQDMVRDEGGAVAKIIEAGGVVYVCGDGARMSHDVWRCFQDLFGVETMDAMKKSGRYLEDVWS